MRHLPVRHLALTVLPLVFAACGESPQKCNGAADLCARPYDEVAYATTHNAYNADDEGYAFPNQTHGITRQLRDGVRALMLDIYDQEGDVLLYHGFYSEILGFGRLADALAEIARFLSANPMRS